MKTIPLFEVCNHDVNAYNIVCINQHWAYPNNYFSYMHTPRLNHGFITILEGEAEYSFDNGTVITARPQDVLFLPQGAKYFVKFTENPTKTILINFSLVDRQNTPLLLSSRLFKLAHCTNEFSIDLFLSLSELYRASTNKLLIKSKFYELLNDLTVQNANNQNQSPLLPAVTYIHNHLNTEIKIPFLANLCAMSESTFRRAFAEATQLSPKKYILNEKIKKARQMLLNSEISVAEICSILEFYDTAYFFKQFKAKTGETPIQYRRRLQNTPSVQN